MVNVIVPYTKTFLQLNHIVAPASTTVHQYLWDLHVNVQIVVWLIVTIHILSIAVTVMKVQIPLLHQQ